MTELKITLIELNKSIRAFLESGRAPKQCDELGKVCYLADRFEKKFNELYDKMYVELYGRPHPTPKQKDYSNAN